MTTKPTDHIRAALDALAAIPTPTERALAAGEMADAVRDATTEVAQIRQGAVQEMRTAGQSYRAIGETLGIHFTRVKQIETGETTGRRKKQAAEEPPADA